MHVTFLHSVSYVGGCPDSSVDVYDQLNLTPNLSGNLPISIGNPRRLLSGIA